MMQRIGAIIFGMVLASSAVHAATSSHDTPDIMLAPSSPDLASICGDNVACEHRFMLNELQRAIESFKQQGIRYEHN